MSVFDIKARRVPHDHHFGGQGLDIRLASLASNRSRNFRFSFVQQMLEVLKAGDAPANSQVEPRWLDSTSTADRLIEFEIGSAFEFAQQFTRGGIDRHNLAGLDL